MKMLEKKRLLKRWMKRFGISYVTIVWHKEGLCAFDFLDETMTSYASFCCGGINNLVEFPISYNDLYLWDPYVSSSDPDALGILVECLDNKQLWRIEQDVMFFCGSHPRIAIDLLGFSWETMAINLDLSEGESFHAKKS